MMSDSISTSETICFAASAKSQTNSLYSFVHFANCTSDLSAGTCRRLPMIGDPVGPGGSGYFDFEPREYNPAASNITTPIKMARLQLAFWLRMASENESMTPAVSLLFPGRPLSQNRAGALTRAFWRYMQISKRVCSRSICARRMTSHPSIRGCQRCIYSLHGDSGV